MNEIGVIPATTDAPVFGEAALQAALAAFRALANVPDTFGDFGAASTNGGSASSRNGGAVADQLPAVSVTSAKTVSQILGEIVWLMTQSPRHRALALSDLECLVMPGDPAAAVSDFL
jgi:cytolysin-activating lysine-acyltransferase